MEKRPEHRAEALPMFVLAEGEPDEVPPARAPWLVRLSAGVARVEAWAAGLAVLGIFVLLLVNVASRTLGRPLIWTDELAVNLMAWAAFIGASLGLAHHQHIAVTLVPDMLPARARRLVALVVDGVLMAFLVVLAVLLWRWLDPVGLLMAGSADAFSATTFNFVYQEPTVTLGVRKIWFWLILPVFCVTGAVHVAAAAAGRLATLKEDRP